MKDKILKAAGILFGSQKTVALTGAGISVESGVPAFRGKGGLWEEIDPLEFATINAFENDPEKVWDVLIRRMKAVMDVAEPNNGHKGLAHLEEMGLLKTIITQNIDGLHQKAGNSDVIEFHGSFATHHCMTCLKSVKTFDLEMADAPPHCSCGGLFRPDIIFFGELIPTEALVRSQELAEGCEVMLVIGTSATVQPAAYMPVIAKENGAVIIEINPESTQLTREISDMIIMGTAGEVVTDLVNAIDVMAKAGSKGM